MYSLFNSLGTFEPAAGIKVDTVFAGVKIGSTTGTLALEGYLVKR
jgi:hypothetical protein